METSKWQTSVTDLDGWKQLELINIWRLSVLNVLIDSLRSGSCKLNAATYEAAWNSSKMHIWCPGRLLVQQFFIQWGKFQQGIKALQDDKTTLVCAGEATTVPK